ncbi:hypothetical protein FRC00_006409 [Tulasnella sp. 408]|nr:hypothetical protein FRC00_006409 [Tulasnella sp. 408]
MNPSNYTRTKSTAMPSQGSSRHNQEVMLQDRAPGYTSPIKRNAAVNRRSRDYQAPDSTPPTAADGPATNIEGANAGPTGDGQQPRPPSASPSPGLEHEREEDDFQKHQDETSEDEDEGEESQLPPEWAEDPSTGETEADDSSIEAVNEQSFPSVDDSTEPSDDSKEWLKEQLAEEIAAHGVTAADGTAWREQHHSVYRWALDGDGKLRVVTEYASELETAFNLAISSEFSRWHRKAFGECGVSKGIVALYASRTGPPGFGSSITYYRRDDDEALQEGSPFSQKAIPPEIVSQVQDYRLQYQKRREREALEPQIEESLKKAGISVQAIRAAREDKTWDKLVDHIESEPKQSIFFDHGGKFHPVRSSR